MLVLGIILLTIILIVLLVRPAGKSATGQPSGRRMSRREADWRAHETGVDADPPIDDDAARAGGMEPGGGDFGGAGASGSWGDSGDGGD